MNIKELVGKKAMRTKGVNLGNGHSDYSYCSEPIEIIKVTEHHIYMKSEDYESILDCRWIDDNWVEYDDTVFAKDKPEEETEIKIGDTVEIIETQKWTNFPVGHIGKITEIGEGMLEGEQCIRAIVDDGDDYWYYPLHKLRKAEEL